MKFRKGDGTWNYYNYPDKETFCSSSIVFAKNRGDWWECLKIRDGFLKLLNELEQDFPDEEIICDVSVKRLYIKFKDSANEAFFILKYVGK